MTALDDLAAIPFFEADAPARARMLSRLADTQLSVALVAEPEGDDIELRRFALQDGQVALACDTEDRLAGFFGVSTPYAGMPGRVLATLLRAEGVGLLVNPGQPSEMLLDAETLGWLENALQSAPEPADVRLRLTTPEPTIIAALAEPLGVRLADMRGLIGGGALVGVADEAGQLSGHLLLIQNAAPDDQPAIAKALAEMLSFLPEQPGGVDISFDTLTLPDFALRFDLTPPERAPRPKGPPILR